MTQYSALLPERLSRLEELAYNLWFSWNEEALELFRAINPVKWETVYHSPVRMLQETSPEDWSRLSADDAFMDLYERAVSAWDAYTGRKAWFHETYPQHEGRHIAYFSAEFGFHESLPIYSGGLGVLAGDHCKSASDLGIPLVAVGLLYKRGYFNQKIDHQGAQISEQVTYDFGKLAIRPAIRNDEEVHVYVELPGRAVRLKVWEVRVGTVPVYLLDADVDGNSYDDRSLTAQLYGGNQDTRIQQEIILGMGGIMALRALELYPYVYHINEGHAAFLSLERIREHIRGGLPFSAALEMVRASTIFTTHTPVPAGHDAFPVGMFEHYLGELLYSLSADRQAIIELGLDRSKNVFNMTYLAMNTATMRNGVSELHGAVSREMFKGFHGNLNASEIPIGHVTNGVHLRTWMAREWKELLDSCLRSDWRVNQSALEQWKALEKVPPETLWDIRRRLKERLIVYAKTNVEEQRRRNGQPADGGAAFLRPDVLTIGFARRFATYKRATLIFRDLERLDRLVNHPERPVQFIFAGKAHPADIPGQKLLREIYQLSQTERFRGKIVLLENYDMNMARYLVQGVDVWLNNPKRPHEASGTSGEKAALNGVLNFSVLDGWWQEGYDGENGWSIDADNRADEETQEKENLESLYSVLEEKIVPLYYNQEEQAAVPVQWIKRMVHSIETLAPQYNTDRMVQDYTNLYYTRIMARALHFSADNYAAATRMADYKRFIRTKWWAVKIVGVEDAYPVVSFAESLSKRLMKTVGVIVHLGEIWYKDVAVEALYWEEQADGAWLPVVVPFSLFGEAVSPGTYKFEGRLPAHLRHGPHFQLRVRPISPDFAHDFEMNEVTIL
ncbi:alpha-glucan family phosphorylase [Paenibacillus sp. YN15]|uniref:alpha-glucan family phosphorylase n=1 Tax=Paenibacillus sp. YN15 TaxID=1742774 RepID=UPI00215BA027|nr:alpha-glucan family phosphorylase [Paenibacillus sp. YN15]